VSSLYIFSTTQLVLQLPASACACCEFGPSLRRNYVSQVRNKSNHSSNKRSICNKVRKQQWRYSRGYQVKRISVKRKWPNYVCKQKLTFSRCSLKHVETVVCIQYSIPETRKLATRSVQPGTEMLHHERYYDTIAQAAFGVTSAEALQVGARDLSRCRALCGNRYNATTATKAWWQTPEQCEAALRGKLTVGRSGPLQGPL